MTVGGTFTTATMNSLRFNTAGAFSITLNTTTSIGSGGILVTSNVGNNLSTITGGTSLTSGNGKDLIIIQNNMSNSLTISSIITGAVGLTKAGAGNLNLGALNTYNGNTTIDAGTLTSILTGGTATGIFGTTAANTITVNQGATLKSTVTDGFGFTYGGGTSHEIIINGGTVTDASGAFRVTLQNLVFTGGSLIAATGNTGDTMGGAFSLQYGSIITNAAYTTATISGTGGNANFGSLSLQTAASTFNVASGFVTTGATPGIDLLISSIIGNYTGITGAITKTGAGVLELSGANTFTGGVTVNAGTLLLGSATAMGPAANATLTFGAGSTGTVILNGFSPTIVGLNSNAGTPVITNNSNTAVTLTVNNTAASTYGGALNNGTGTGAVSLTKNGSGTLTFNPAAALGYTGATTIKGGALVLDFSNLSAPTNLVQPSSTLSLGSGSAAASLTVKGNATSSTAQTFASLSLGATTLGIAPNDSIILNPNGGTSTILTITSNTLTTGANAFLNFNYSAGTTSGSILGTAYVAWNPTLTGGIIGTAYTVTDASGSGFATVASGNVVRMAASSVTALPASGATSATNYGIYLNSGDTTTPGSLTLIQTASQAVNTLTVDTTAVAGNVGLGTTVLQAAAIAFTGANPFALTASSPGGLQAVTSGGNLFIDNRAGAAVTISAPVLANGASTLTINGTGTTILSGANTYTGATTLLGGTVGINNGAAFGAGTAAVIINPGVIIDANIGTTGAVALSTNHTMTWNGSFTFAGSNALNLGAGAVTMAAATTLTTIANTLTIGGNIGATALSFTKAGAGALVLNGNVSLTSGAVVVSAGTLTLAGTNAYTGASNVASGATLIINSATALGGTTAWVINTTSTIDSTVGVTLTGNPTFTFGNFHFTGTANLSLGGGAVSNNASGRVITLDSTNGSVLTFSGTMTNTANANNTTTVNGVGNLIKFAGYNLSNNGTTNYADTFNGTGNVTFTGALVNGATATASAFTYSGTGTLTLSGASTYLGATTFSNGTVVLNNAAVLGNTAVTVASGATNALVDIKGNNAVGTTTGSLTIGASTGVGTIAFLNSEATVSTLTIGNTAANTSLTLGHATNIDTAQLSMNYGANAVDSITTAGKLAVNAGGALINLAPLSGGTVTVGTTYNLLTFASATNANLIQLGSYTAPAGDMFYLTQTATNVVLNVVATGNTTGAAYWAGSQNSVWNTNIGGGTTNWVQGPGLGSGDALMPVATTNVFFTATGAGNLATTLGQGFNINSLNFVSTSSATSVGGNAPLTIYATNANGNTAGSGITVASGAAAQTISAPIILAGNQTWTNSSASLLTISGGVAGAFNLTLDNGGTGTGGFTLSAVTASLVVNNTGTLTNTTTAGTITISAVIGANVTGVTQNGPGSTLTLSGANLNTGSVTLTAGAVNVNSATALGAAATTFVINGGTFDNSTAAAITMTNANPQTWAGDFTFTGTKSLTFTTGAITITNSTRNVTVNGEVP